MEAFFLTARLGIVTQETVTAEDFAVVVSNRKWAPAMQTIMVASHR